jgi:hypothetical protein
LQIGLERSERQDAKEAKAKPPRRDGTADCAEGADFRIGISNQRHLRNLRFHLLCSDFLGGFALASLASWRSFTDFAIRWCPRALSA